MTEAYKIVAKPAISHTGASVCSLNISMGNPNQTGSKFEAMIAWVNQHFNYCIINLSDTLQRHNFMAQGYTLQEAHEKAVDLGNNWLKQNETIIKKLSVKNVIVRWDEWLAIPEVQDNIFKVTEWYEKNPAFQECVKADARKWQTRQEINIPLTYSIFFLLEEIGVHSYIASKEYAKGNFLAHCYPAKQLLSENFIRKNFEGSGLEKSIFIRQKVEKTL